jgi:hypothetical protein
MKNAIVLTTALTLLVGCSSTPTMQDCLERNRFLHEGECKNFNSIPYEDQDNVITQIADEIAEAQNITRDDALRLLYGIMLESEE